MFDIISLANQLYQSKSTIPRDPELGKIYFSENLTIDLLTKGIKEFENVTNEFNQSLERNKVIKAIVNSHGEDGLAGRRDYPIDLDWGENDAVNELFQTTQESLNLTTNLTDLFI